ncbi:hypothetical protein [Streptomyces sp. MW-W600-10]|uniref:hypothetical protein n=1 Tax=Streptomyces sp. MW-W600-10 TaxID=2829819 RepID=UPI001C46B39B|nr:hypothetical protein [Streptomyces sp. MW-W600-10]MBV7243668.1 hypothetical protein [Streptomyces sp. MW-W600-10]MBV7249266.1 hypothetical protein [Streptomyces sp. MW-W600-10]
MTNHMLETAAAIAAVIVILPAPHDPCGPAADRAAITALDHVRAIGNHLRALSRLAINFGQGNTQDDDTHS